MRLYPFLECVAAVDNLIRQGQTVHQQFLCAACGVKQTMEEINTFYAAGKCEECGHVTNIAANGCNYLAVFH
jgi:hypothetical protein